MAYIRGYGGSESTAMVVDDTPQRTCAHIDDLPYRTQRDLWIDQPLVRRVQAARAAPGLLGTHAGTWHLKDDVEESSPVIYTSLRWGDQLTEHSRALIEQVQQLSVHPAESGLTTKKDDYGNLLFYYTEPAPGAPRHLATVHHKLIDRLEELRQSGDSYVYPGGTRPADAAFNDARLFIENLPVLAIEPAISLVVDGEINFSWKTDDIYVDLGFYGDGDGGSCFAEDCAGRKYYYDSFPADELPEEVARLIT